VRTQMAVKNGTPPAYWDVQTRCYMELLGASFTCLFLGWGPRPTLDFTAMTRIERDPDLGESILESCENFVERTKKGIRPGFQDVEEPELIRKYFANQYNSKALRNEEAKITPKTEALKALLAAEEKLEAAKEEKRALDTKIKALEKDYLLKQTPFIEDLKDSEYGYTEDAEGNRYCLSYKPTRSTVSVEELKALYPEIFEKVRKDGVDTTKLKTLYPEAYTKCRIPGENRKFSIRKVNAPGEKKK